MKVPEDNGKVHGCRRVLLLGYMMQMSSRGDGGDSFGYISEQFLDLYFSNAAQCQCL